MDKLLQEITEKINSSPIDEREKATLIQALPPIFQQQQERIDFFRSRMLKDKNIAVNLLNQAIANLQSKQEHIQKANQTLLEQKLLLEKKSKQLRESLERLEMSYEELEQFSYIASHDLKSPLRTIASYAQLLQRRYRSQLDEEGEEFINFIVSGAKQMNDIISDLLDYSFIREQKLVLTPIDFQEILATVSFNLQSEINDSNATIEVGELPTQLVASKSGMLQLFQNLIGNAIKFRSNANPHIHISATREEKHWLFIIEDNGIGLDEAYAHKVFLPFQRLSNDAFPGSGIGLAICRKIVKLHQGTIWYNGQLEKGTTFYFTLSCEK